MDGPCMVVTAGYKTLRLFNRGSTTLIGVAKHNQIFVEPKYVVDRRLPSWEGRKSDREILGVRISNLEVPGCDAQ